MISLTMKTVVVSKSSTSFQVESINLFCCFW